MNAGLTLDEIDRDGRLGTLDMACPFCGPYRRSAVNRRRKVLRVWRIDPGYATYHCVRCGEQGYARDTSTTQGRPDFSHVRKTPPPKRACIDDNGRSDFAARIWQESVDPRGSLAERYLNGRGLALPDDLALRVLRFHGHCPFGKNDAGKVIYAPALIAAFRPICEDDESKPPPAIHRIGLKPDGTKIGKKMLGPVAGCAVKLDADDAVEEGLGICEGVETGLAIRAIGWRPVWALGSAGAIRLLDPIPGIEALTIFADNDESGTGIEAARECAQRWADAGLEATIRTPNRDGKDWADV
jgi:hypothetical protein